MKKLRIGIDATCWWNQRGFGRFTRQLLGAMFADLRGHEFCLFIDHAPDPEMLRPNVRTVQVSTSSTVTDAAVADRNRSIADLLAFRRAVAREPLDVMYFPAVYSWYPTGGRAPVVVTFHDAIAEKFPTLVMPRLRGRVLWTVKTWLARWTAARMTTVSHAARAEIVEQFGLDPKRIDVVLEAADQIFRPVSDDAIRISVRQRLQLPVSAPIILYVGGFAPHKNLIGLIKGFTAAITLPGTEILHLVLVGDPEGAGFHSNAQELRMMIASEPRLRDRVHFTGFVSDADLVVLYSVATAVAMPAFSEGFGLPAAEAIACGTPVIASRGGAVEEVVGPAGLFFDPYDVDDIAAAIVRISSDPTALAVLRRECLPRAAEMSWTKGAAAMLDILEHTAAAR